jgi:hypothetical protein
MSRFVSHRVNIGRSAINAEKIVVMTVAMKGVDAVSAGEMTGVIAVIRVAIRGATEVSSGDRNVIDFIYFFINRFVCVCPLLRLA